MGGWLKVASRAAAFRGLKFRLSRRNREAHPGVALGTQRAFSQLLGKG